MTISKEEFSIIVPEYGVNYITNPVPYQATTGFSYTNGTMSIDSTYTRRGPACLKMVPTSGQNSTIYFSPLSVTSGQPYTFSLDVKGYAGQAMRIMIQNGSGTMQAQKTFIATGNWQRIVLTLASAGATATNWRAVVQRDSVASTQPFWADGWQFENKAYATTFIYGDEKGLGYIDREYYWAGTPFASASVRSAFTRHGGKLVKINDYAIINKVVGLGMGTFESHISELAMGGSVLQSTIRQSRPFSFLLTFKGSSQDAIYANRQVIIDAIRPDRDNQPLLLHYQGFDSSGNEVTQPIDIICKAEVSLQDTPNLPTRHTDLLSFTALDATLDGAYYEGSYVLYTNTLSVSNIVRQLPNGTWDNMQNKLPSLAYAIAEAPNGDIYVGGDFADLSGVTGSAKLARWSKANDTWETVLPTPPNGAVTALKFDSEGNLYIGGSFFQLCNAIGANGIAKISGLPGTVTITSLGNGLYDPVYPIVNCIEIGPKGDVWVGGIFEKADGKTANGLAQWDGLSWSAKGMTANSEITNIIWSPTAGNFLVFGRMSNLISGYSNVCAAQRVAGVWSLFGGDEIVQDSSNGVYSAAQSVGGGVVFVGGYFSNFAGSGVEHYLAFTNGQQWYLPPCGDVDATVYTIAMSGLDTYVGGDFTKAGQLTLMDRVAKLRNLAWQRVPIDLPGSGRVANIFIARDKTLYLSGSWSGTAYLDQITEALLNISGTANTYPIIQIKGPGNLKSIQNKTNGKQIDFEDFYLQPNEYITLRFDPHNLKFESSWADRGSVLNYITAGSNIADFNLAPGVNNISIYMPTDTDGNTNAWIRWKPKFWSLDGAAL